MTPPDFFGRKHPTMRQIQAQCFTPRALLRTWAFLLSGVALFLGLNLQPVAQAQTNARPSAPATVDLPPCEAARSGAGQVPTVGVVLPHGNPHVVQYLGELSLKQPQLEVCFETWQPVLPHWWSPLPQALGRAYPFGIYLLGFLVAVGTLGMITPRSQWRRVTLVGVLTVGGLTWILGIAAQAAFHAVGGQRWAYDTVISLRDGQGAIEWLEVPGARELDALLAQRQMLVHAPAAAPEPVTATPIGQEPSGSYRVAHRLNLRTGPGTQHERLSTLPREAVVQFIGPREGDWWHLRAPNGQEGWASSLWLRRMGEGLPAAPAQGEAKS